MERTEPTEPRYYSVSGRERAPLVQFISEALEVSGCRLLYTPSPDRAPFRFTFETPTGERMGIMVYAFLANRKVTKNRPSDERRFQVKYGTRDGALHSIWQDPFGLYTTLFVGIDPVDGFVVAADPVLHDPTRLFISMEFKDTHAAEIIASGWHAWERDRRSGSRADRPIEVLVGARPERFLSLVEFERAALGEDQGHRQLLAEHVGCGARVGSATSSTAEVETSPSLGAPVRAAGRPDLGVAPGGVRLHDLATEFQLSEREVLDLIASARRLKMAVRGWVAETHLVRVLQEVPGVTECGRDDAEGAVDVRLRFEGSRVLRVECKNVLRKTAANGDARLDFQRTRASLGDPCTRYYGPEDFDVVAACLHAVTERWEFRFADPRHLPPHRRCAGKISNTIRIDESWQASVRDVLMEVAGG